MEKNKINYKEVKQIIDHDTGEVTKTETMESMQVPKEPDYVKIYIADIIKLKDLPKSHSSVLVAMLQGMNYYNEIPLISCTKKRICDEVNISMETLNKAIQAMTRRGIINRKGQGLYEANPFLFGRGKWSDIHKLRLSITYSKEGKHIEAKIDKKK